MQTNFADDNLNDRWKRQLIYLTEKLKCFGVIIEDISELISVICEAGLSSVIVVSPRSQSVLQLYAHFCNNIIPLLKTTSFTQNQVTYNLPFDNASFNYNAKVIFVTDEELIRQMMQNPLLSEYAIIIVEGFAEPSANTEFLLFLLKKILYSRQETKFRIVLVGSTCNPLLEKCVAFMSQPGKLSVTLPIILSALPKKDVSYFPVIKFLSTVKSIEQLLLPKRILSDCLATISTMLRHQINSNYLMIFPGVEEIDDFKFLLQQNLDEKYQIGVKSIHSGVPTHEQEKIYDELEKNYTYPSSSLIVLSTSIVDFMPKDYFHTVIDTGLIRLRFFDHENRTSRLSMVPISRSLADRRASSFSNHPSAKTTGRKELVRLYSHEIYEKHLPAETMPEIERIDLTLIMLRLRAFEYTKIPKFPLGSPSKLAITHALGHLVQLGAIDPRTGIITPRIGRMMAALPLGPELSRCLIAGFDLGCQDEVLSLCSMLTVRPVFSDWEQQKKRANSDSSEDLFRAEEGDLVTLVNVYRHFIDGNKGLGWCQRQKLIYGALCKAKRIYSLLSRQISYLQSIYDHQIIPIVSDLPFSFGSTSSIKKSFNSKKKDSPDCTLLLRAICLGFSANSAILMSDGSYKVVDCNKSNLAIHPSSVLFARKPTLLVFTDVLETKKAYMHYVSAISDPRWLF